MAAVEDPVMVEAMPLGELDDLLAYVGALGITAAAMHRDVGAEIDQVVGQEDVGVRAQYMRVAGREIIGMRADQAGDRVYERVAFPLRPWNGDGLLGDPDHAALVGQLVIDKRVADRDQVR